MNQKPTLLYQTIPKKPNQTNNKIKALFAPIFILTYILTHKNFACSVKCQVSRWTRSIKFLNWCREWRSEWGTFCVLSRVASQLKTDITVPNHTQTNQPNQTNNKIKALFAPIFILTYILTHKNFACLNSGIVILPKPNWEFVVEQPRLIWWAATAYMVVCRPIFVSNPTDALVGF